MGAMTYRKIDWNAKQVDKDLRKMTPTAFVHKYKVSYPLVVKRRKVLGLSRPHSTRKPVPRGFVKAAQRLTSAALGQKYGVSNSTVGEWRAQVGIKGEHARAVADTQLAERVQHYADLEWGGAAIATKLRVSTSRVYRIARMHGIVFQTVVKDMRTVRNALMVSLVASGLTHDQVAKVFNISRQGVQRATGPKAKN